MSPETQALIRLCYGVLLLLILGQAWPQRNRFFLSERYGGYADDGPATTPLHNPRAMIGLLILWLAAALGLVTGTCALAAAAINLALCRYYFVTMRWKGILRGMGAPGFMTYWVGAAVLFLEFTGRFAPVGLTRDLGLLAFRADFAAIMICAGLYKALSGYPAGEGMERGLSNPAWGYWWKAYSKLPPGHPIFRALNHLAYGVEILAGILLLIPQTRLLGAAALAGSFVFIALNLRLGWLAQMVLVAMLLFVSPGDPVDRLLGGQAALALGLHGFPLVNAALIGFFGVYLALLPLAKAGQYYNFYGRKRLPAILQTALDRWTNAFGIVIWRVFTTDVISFHVDVAIETNTGERTPYRPRGFRYAHVGESICLASLFTTRIYHPDAPDLFDRKLLRYARTIPCPPAGHIVFTQISVGKTSASFTHIPRIEYRVDPALGIVTARPIDEGFDPRSAAAGSPVHDCRTPGSYAPRSLSAPVPPSGTESNKVHPV